MLVHAQVLSYVWPSATPRIVTLQAPLSMGLSWQEQLEWVATSSSRRSSRPRDLLSPTLADRLFTTSITWKALAIFGEFESRMPYSLNMASCYQSGRWSVSLISAVQGWVSSMEGLISGSKLLISDQESLANSELDFLTVMISIRVIWMCGELGNI